MKYNGSPEYRPATYFTRLYSISSQCLRTWHGKGEINAIRLNGDKGKRLYKVSDIIHRLGVQSQQKHRILYARVSSSKQKEDLQRQIDDLKLEYPEHQCVYKDIASGANFKRQGLQALLEQVYRGAVKEVVVMYRDRLARIGIELLEQIFNRFGVKLVVHNKGKEDESDKRDDLVSIITLFVASHHGKRAAENKKRRKREREEAIDDTREKKQKIEA